MTSGSTTAPSMSTTLILIGYGPPENWEKNFGPPPQERNERTFDHRENQYNQRGGMPSRGRGHGRGTFKPPYCMYHDSDTNHHTKD
jgi:hypothetical protein